MCKFCSSPAEKATYGYQVTSSVTAAIIQRNGMSSLVTRQGDSARAVSGSFAADKAQRLASKVVEQRRVLIDEAMKKHGISEADLTAYPMPERSAAVAFAPTGHQEDRITLDIAVAEVLAGYASAVRSARAAQLSSASSSSPALATSASAVVHEPVARQSSPVRQGHSVSAGSAVPGTSASASPVLHRPATAHALPGSESYPIAASSTTHIPRPAMAGRSSTSATAATRMRAPVEMKQPASCGSSSSASSSAMHGTGLAHKRGSLEQKRARLDALSHPWDDHHFLKRLAVSVAGHIFDIAEYKTVRASFFFVTQHNACVLDYSKGVVDPVLLRVRLSGIGHTEDDDEFRAVKTAEDVKAEKIEFSFDAIEASKNDRRNLQTAAERTLAFEALGTWTALTHFMPPGQAAASSSSSAPSVREHGASPDGGDPASTQ